MTELHGVPNTTRQLGEEIVEPVPMPPVMIAWIRFSTLVAALYVGNLAGAKALEPILVNEAEGGYYLAE